MFSRDKAQTKAKQPIASPAPLPADEAAAHCAQGRAQLEAGQFAAARGSFRRAVSLRHDCVEALVGEGEASAALGAPEDARDAFELALAFDEACVPALVNLARLWRNAGNPAQALAALERALKLAADSASLHCEHALVLNQTGDTQGALAAYERALECNPDHIPALVNLGLVYLTQRNDGRKAQQVFERAAALDPKAVAAQANLGLALQEQGRFAEALAHYDALIAAHPAEVEYRWNRALALLTQGDFERGWPDYELRHARVGRDVNPRLPLPKWDGSDAAHHRILVFAEQGLGDEIMFASCVPDLVRAAGKVVLECDERVAALFRRSFPAATVHGAGRNDGAEWLRAYPDLDCQIPIGSLPRLFRRRAGDFPRHNGYLAVDPLRVAAWKSRFAGNGRVRHVGFSWRGGTRKTRAEQRSLPFEMCLPWLAQPRCHFICLQHGDCSEELAVAANDGVLVEHWPQALADVDELAALIAALDAVITVDSTVAHLAGAVGQRAWVLLARPAEWRYGCGGESMPWYPSLRLFRQQTAGDWRPMVDAVASELAAIAPR